MTDEVRLFRAGAGEDPVNELALSAADSAMSPVAKAAGSAAWMPPFSMTDAAPKFVAYKQ